VIGSFRHRGLKRLYEDDDSRKPFAEHVNRISLILAALDAAKTAQDLDMHTFHLHQLKGERKGMWAVTVRANWRMIFRFEKGQALDIDLVDYH
jgi:proteic killer suppression protein